MADFRKALQALGAGKLNPIVLAESIDKLLTQQPQLADALLNQLAEARTTGVISEEQYAAVRECITSLSYNPAKRAPPQDTPRDEHLEATEVRTAMRTEVRAAPVAPSAPEIDDDEHTVFKPTPRPTPPPVPASSQPPASDVYAATEVNALPSSSAGLDPQGYSGGSLDLDLSGPLPDSSSPSLDISLRSTGNNLGTAGTAEGDGPVGPGTVLNEHFVLEEQIGRGGMGAVYKGKDLLSVEAQDRNPYVAVKVLNEDFKRHPKAFIALHREAIRQRNLAHPNIVRVHSFERAGGVVFMTMELLQGTPLNRFIADRRQNDEGGLSFNETFRITSALGHALQFAHERGIVHSDFKPGNCFLCRDGTVKVLDFGIARAIPGAGVSRDGAGDETKFNAEELGALTVAYASLEMLQGAEPDARDDLYALACVTYELLTLTHPFGKQGADKAREKGLVPQAIKGLSKRQMNALLRGLAFERQHRNPDIKTFLREFEGKIEPWRNPWVVAPAAAVLLSVPGFLLVRAGLERASITKIEHGIEASDASGFASALEGIASLNDNARRLFVEQRLPLLEAQFEQRVMQHLDKREFGLADSLLKRGDQLRSSWGIVALLRERLKQQRAQRILDLRSLIDKCGTNAQCLAATAGEQSYARLLSELRQLAPEDGLLADAAVATRYADKVRALLSTDDLKNAGSVLAAGVSLLPGNAQLTALLRDVTTRQDTHRTEEEVSALAAQLNRALPGVKILDGAQAVLKLVVDLGQRNPSHPALSAAGLKLKPIVEAEFATLSAKRQWPILAHNVELLKPVGALLGLTSALNTAINSLARFDGEVNQRLADLNTVIAAKNLLSPAGNNAIAIYGNLTKLLGDGAKLDEARALVESALIREARQALARNDFSKVESLADAATALGVSDTVKDDLARLKEDLTLAQSTKESTEKERLQLARIDRLVDLFAQTLSALDASAASITNVLGIVDELAALNPTHPLVRASQPKIEARLIEIVNAASTRKDYKTALGVLDAATAAKFVGSATLVDLRVRLAAQQNDVAKNEAEAVLAQGKAEVDALIADAKFDAVWQKKLDRALDLAATKLKSDDSWLLDARQRIVTTYIAEFNRQIDGKNFDSAKGLLVHLNQKSYGDVAGKDKIGTLQKTLDNAESDWKASRLVAELDSRKAEIKTLIEASKLADARKRWDTLKPELPTNDPFGAEANKLFADAYLALAQSRAAKEPDKALIFVLEGLRVAPDFEPLKTLSTELLKKSADAAVKAVGAMDPSQPGTTAALIDGLRKGSAENFKALAQSLQTTANTRITTLASSDPSLCASYVLAVAKILPELKLSGCPAVSNSFVAEFDAAFTDRKLGAAQSILDKATAEQQRLADYSKAVDKLRKRKQLAETTATQATTAAGQGDKAAADKALVAARALWIDRPESEWPKIVATAPSPETNPAPNPEKKTTLISGGGVACTLSFAGKGLSPRAVCYDKIEEKFNGPEMVVVPAAGGVGAFAVGRFEISFEDYNHFCEATSGCSPLAGAKGAPVTGIALDSAVKYLQWLTTQTGHKYRLPTGAEWEYAASSGGANTDKNFNCRLVVGGNVMKGLGPMPEKSGHKNPWGLFNAVGNVQEWIEGGKVRGGSYQDDIDKCSPTLEKDHPGTPDALTGFRAVRDLG